MITAHESRLRSVHLVKNSSTSVHGGEPQTARNLARRAEEQKRKAHAPMLHSSKNFACAASEEEDSRLIRDFDEVIGHTGGGTRIAGIATVYAE